LIAKEVPYFNNGSVSTFRTAAGDPGGRFHLQEISMTILFINNDGGGFADHVEVTDGLRVAELFSEKMPGRKASDFLIRVNRQPAAADQVLQPGDRVSITPTKIEGAR
jgi:hypothetical protein